MDTPIKEALIQILSTCSDAQTMFITDREGVLVVGVGDELRSRQQFIAGYQTASDQISKLEMGHQKVTLFAYEQMQLIVMSFHNLNVFICAKTSANTGLLMQLRSRVEKVGFSVFFSKTTYFARRFILVAAAK